MPALATTVVYNFCTNELKRQWYRARSGLIGKTVHVWSSAFKATMSSAMRDTLQTCREACGGQGYKSDNRIGVLRTDRDVTLTFEGDNHVLMQQVAKAILADFVAGSPRPFWPILWPAWSLGAFAGSCSI